MRKEQFFKLVATIVGATLLLSIKEVHAAAGNVHIKEMAQPPKYLVNGKEVNAAEATVAVLKGERAMKCTEMEVEAGRNGLSLKAKKSQ